MLISHFISTAGLDAATGTKSVKCVGATGKSGFSCLDFFFCLFSNMSNFVCNWPLQFLWRWVFIKVPVNTVHENISIIFKRAEDTFIRPVHQLELL